MERPQNTKNRTTIWFSNPTSGYISQEMKPPSPTCTPMFIAALFTAAETWKQPKHPLMDGWVKKNVICIYTMEYISHKKEQNSTTCNNINKP